MREYLLPRAGTQSGTSAQFVQISAPNGSDFLKEALGAFVRGDESLAVKICENREYAPLVNNLEEQIQRESPTFMMTGPLSNRPGNQGKPPFQELNAHSKSRHQYGGNNDLHGKREGCPAHQDRH